MGARISRFHDKPKLAVLYPRNVKCGYLAELEIRALETRMKYVLCIEDSTGFFSDFAILRFFRVLVLVVDSL